MTTLNVTTPRQQVLIDEQQLAKLQSEFARRALELERLKAAFETLAAVNTPARFMAAAMALCNELASRFKAERVGIGFLKGRYVRLQALSHTEKITRHMQLVQDIEAAMEECLDQDVEVIVPPPKDASFVYRAADQLSSHHGPSAVCALPLRRKVTLVKKTADQNSDSDVVAVLALERAVEKPFTLEELETLRLTCDLFTARLVDLYEQDRWLGAKALRETRRAFAWAVGTKHTWAKVAAIAIAGLAAFAFFVKGNHRVEAPFVFEPSEKQVVSAPFDGELQSAHAIAGDFVISQATADRLDALNSASAFVPLIPFRQPVTILATLKTTELQDKLISAKYERLGHLQEAKNYRSPKDGQPNEAAAQVADFEAAKADAQVKLYSQQIEKATIKAPLDGVVLSGDLKTKLGGPVKTGDELFQVGERRMRAELSVPEDQIAYLVERQQKGDLAASTFPEQHIPFTVEHIFPLAVVTGGHNVFKVRVSIDPRDAKSWMKPGMEGIAKIQIDQQTYAWIWTHRLVNWVRMKLWL